MAEPPSASQTIVFADIVESTQLYERLGDTAAKKLVTSCFDIMHAVITANQGHVVKTIGDEVMARFATPDTAAKAAVELHEAVAADGRLAPENIRLRIGFHHGPSIEAQDDFYGDAVNVAARMASQAKAEQIITSRQTLEKLNPEFYARARMVDQARVKGKTDPIEIFEIAWGQPEELTMMGTITRQMFLQDYQVQVLMTLDFEDRHVRVDPEHPTVTLGRDPSNHLVVDNPKVSRLHARVEIRKGKFILTDQSTNGTYVYPKEGKMSHLRRDEMPLGAEGYFSLGQAVRPDSSLAVHFMSI